MKRFLVFYANRLHAEMTLQEVRALHTTEPEVWQGAYIYDRVRQALGGTGWLHGDFTHIPENQVPKATRLMKMILT
jgi:hypothetical protein